jgi:uncharacterized membrane protein
MDVHGKWAVFGLTTALTITMPAVATAAPAEPVQGRLIVLGHLGGGDFSYARGINDRGDIVGVSVSEDGGSYAPALWRQGRIMPIALRVEDGSPEAINNNGVVVGSAGANRLFVWRNGQARYFDPPGRDDGISVADVNDRAQVVGSTLNSTTSSGRAFVWAARTAPRSTSTTRARSLAPAMCRDPRRPIPSCGRTAR